MNEELGEVLHELMVVWLLPKGRQTHGKERKKSEEEFVEKRKPEREEVERTTRVLVEVEKLRVEGCRSPKGFSRDLRRKYEDNSNDGLIVEVWLKVSSIVGR